MGVVLAVAGSVALGGEGGLFNAESSVPVKIYGYVKLDMARDNSRLNNGDFADWVLSETDKHNDPEFNATAKQTRLGIAFGEMDCGPAKVTGKVEADFYGVGAADNKPGLLLRHAFVKADFEALDLSVIAGQTSDLISPLFMPTINYAVGWWQGNIGYRRPQLRVTKGFNMSLGPVQRLELAVAATRNIGVAAGDPPFASDDTGEDSGLPGFQWRVAVKLDLLTDKPTVIGVFGSVHTEEYDTDAVNDDEDIGSDMVGVDLTLPLTEWLGLKAEFFQGRNLSTFLGGIGQGLNGTDEVSTTGGWVAATVKLPALEQLTLNAGYGMDNPDDDDIVADMRTKNTVGFINGMYNIGGGLSTGLELMYLETEYEDSQVACASRVQFTVIYKF
jgi:hypothetical protein